MKALHILHWLNRGGAENWLITILRELSRRPAVQRPFQLDVLCKGASVGEMSTEAATLGANIVHLPQGRIGYFSSNYRAQVQELIRKRGYSVIHSHLGDLSGPYLEAAKGAGVSVRIAAYHSIRHKLARTSLPGLAKIPGLNAVFQAFQSHERERVVRSSSCVLGCSQSVLDEHFQHHKGEACFKVLYPPVDSVRFEDAPLVQLPGKSSQGSRRFKIINVGNVDYSKNQLVIPMVAALLKRKGFDVTFYVVGFGNLLENLRSEIHKHGVEKEVILLGKRSDVPGLLKSADLAFHPSIVEGFPVSVLEYQAAGLPVCGSDIGPMREACAPENVNLLSAPADVEGHARCIESLLCDGALLKNASLLAKSWVQGHFKSTEHVDALARLYSECGSL